MWIIWYFGGKENQRAEKKSESVPIYTLQERSNPHYFTYSLPLLRKISLMSLNPAHQSLPLNLSFYHQLTNLWPQYLAYNSHIPTSCEAVSKNTGLSQTSWFKSWLYYDWFCILKPITYFPRACFLICKMDVTTPDFAEFFFFPNFFISAVSDWGAFYNLH